jgi:nitrogen regulatory protein P-II 1
VKKLEIIIRPEKFDILKLTLSDLGIKGMTASTVMGCGNQKGMNELYRGNQLSVNLLYKVKVEIVVRELGIDRLIDNIRDAVSTGHEGDGKIFIYNVEDAVRIRTGERGNDAI